MPTVTGYAPLVNKVDFTDDTIVIGSGNTIIDIWATYTIGGYEYTRDVTFLQSSMVRNMIRPFGSTHPSGSTGLTFGLKLPYGAQFIRCHVTTQSIITLTNP